MRFSKRVLGPLAACALSSAPAYSQTSSKVAAEALFEDGRQLMIEGKYADACPKFAASERLDPSSSTLLNLASCYERQGRIASAWATYKEAASSANAAGRSDYLIAAERHASALEPNLAKLTLNVDRPVDGLRIERDGADVERAEWGIAIPVDPGPHVIAASASSYKAWSSTISIAQNGAQVTVNVPPLEPLPVETPSVAPPAAPLAPVAAPTPAVDADRHSGPSTQIAMAWIVGGLGVVGLGVGTGFAISAKNKYQSTLSECETANPNMCSSQGVTDRNNARSQGDGATLAVGLGAAAVVAGAVLWLTAPPSASAKHGVSLQITPGLGGGSLSGEW
jgi:hypothetical protein